MSVLDRKLVRDLWNMRGQAVAIAAVIMGGVATLVMSLSTYDSLATTRDRFYRDYHFAEVFANLKRAPESVAERLREIPGVDRLETRVVGAAKLELEGFGEPVSGLVLSLPERGDALLNRLHLKRGRMVEPFADDEAILSDTLADAHRIVPGEKLALIMNGKRKTLTVVGIAVSPEYVYQIAPGALFPDFKRYGVLWMRRGALAAAYDLDGAFNNVSLSLARGVNDADAVIGRVDSILARYGGTGAYARHDQFSDHFLAEELKQLRTTATIFPVIFLSVAAFLLNVVLSRLFALQREQIAILKAFGYSNSAIGWHYVKLVMLIVVIGVVTGSLLGAWFGHGLARIYAETSFRFPWLDYHVGAGIVVLALVVSALAAISGTLLSVLRAARLSPAQGMRPETPAGYRATWIERVGNLGGGVLAAPSRMILRHIGRHPAKSALTVVGIACAGGLMMMGNYQEDAVRFMVDVHFRQSAREDLSLTFSEPTAASALHEVAALPGVAHVEGFRDVPAVLRFRNHSYRGAVYGIAPLGQLHRSLDRNLRPVAVPERGVVLTDYLAEEILHVRPGDSITVEVLEGRRQVVQVPVLGITRQYLGVSAYMQKDSLNALLGEGDVVSGAYVALVPGGEAAVTALLHERPRVLGMVANAAAVRSFYETLGQFVLFYNTVVTLLAGAIGFGVVYNSARVALSERERELASLRVLGLTRGEVAYILLGELALLALAAVPLGMLVGVGLIGIMVLALDSELYRLPMTLPPANYALGAALVIGATLLSAALVWRKLGKLDLVGVLKTRE